MKSTFLGVVVVLGMLAASDALAANPPTDGYLNLAPLGYATPPAPTDPLALELDLVQVRAAHPSPTAIQWQEAASDADAYIAEDIVRRFDDATGALLYEADRPLLVAMLRKIIIDTGAYAGQAKAANPRPRPYVEDPSITPCNTNYLAGTEQQSYPSGHAMNGYVAAIVLADVFPARRQGILARGVRYGDNRVACGVHHPTDVEAGRLLGIAYYHRLSALPAFEADLKCAQAEEALATSKTPMPAACAASREAILRSLAAPKAKTPNAANLF
jgi:acid phosphatase (class A)